MSEAAIGAGATALVGGIVKLVGSREQLIALPGLGQARADAIIARRAQGRLVSIEDLRGALPTQVVQALREHAATMIGDDDEPIDGLVEKRR